MITTGCSFNYCIQGTNSVFDDTYFAILNPTSPTYNGELYWTGYTNGHYLYYKSATTQWCLSTYLGGPCLLSGPSPSPNSCPNLSEYFFDICGDCDTENLVENGEFTSNLSGWTATPISSWSAVSGTALYVSGTTGGSISQDILTTGITYIVSLDLGVSGSSGCFEFYISAGTTSYGPITNSGNTTINVVLECSATTNFSLYAIDNCSPSNKIFVDNVCVLELPVVTTTTTSPCNDFDFDAIFDCYVPPTTTTTSTSTTTTTTTLPPAICSGVGVNAIAQYIPPDPTPTTTTTSTTIPPVVRDCVFFGDATFTTVNSIIECPGLDGDPLSEQFQDCYTGELLYSTIPISTPSGNTITKFMIFRATVDGVSRCISYLGQNTCNTGVNNIVLNEGPIGYSNIGECYLCSPPPPTTTTTSTSTTTTTSTSTTTTTTLPPIICDLEGYSFEINKE